MENATKALLIAAAVLIAVLIISLGVIVYNKASEAVTGAGDLSEYQTQQFNEKFTKYQSASATGSDANALLTTVMTHNNAQESTSTCVSVDVVGATGGSVTSKTDYISASNKISTTPSKLPTGSRYKIECSINTNTKLVNKITITEIK